MKTDFSFKINYTVSPTLIKDIKEGNLDYEFWGVLDFYINQESFFKNFNDNKGLMGSSSITKNGMTIPIYPVLKQLMYSLLEIKKHKIIFIEDETMQIDKKIIIRLVDTTIVLSICNIEFLSKLKYCFNGNEIFKINNEDFYDQNNRGVSLKEFIYGMKVSFIEFYDSLPIEIKNTNEFRELQNLQID